VLECVEGCSFLPNHRKAWPLSRRAPRRGAATVVVSPRPCGAAAWSSAFSSALASDRCIGMRYALLLGTTCGVPLVFVVAVRCVFSWLPSQRMGSHAFASWPPWRPLHATAGVFVPASKLHNTQRASPVLETRRTRGSGRWLRGQVEGEGDRGWGDLVLVVALNVGERLNRTQPLPNCLRRRSTRNPRRLHPRASSPCRTLLTEKSHQNSSRLGRTPPFLLSSPLY
jgi:hypothetical protein